MRILRHWKLLVTLALVFVAGAISGTAWTIFWFKRSFERGFSFENMTAGIMARIQQRLNLAEEQRPKIKAILDEGALEMKGQLTRTTQDCGAILVRTVARVDGELTPEQRVLHRQMYEEFRQHLQKFMKIELPEMAIGSAPK